MNCYGEHGGEKNPISLGDKNNTYLNNAHRYIFTHSCPRHTSHTKQDSLELQLDVSRKTLLLSPVSPESARVPGESEVELIGGTKLESVITQGLCLKQ